MSASDMVQFQTEAQARDAYFTDSDGEPTDPPAPGTGWGDPVDIDVLEGNWYLLEQTQIEGDATRYFVLVGPDPETTQAMRRGGGTVEVTENDSFDDLPSMDTEDEAREAHALWMEEHEDEIEDDDRDDENTGEEDDEGNMWSAWEQAEEVPPWYVFARVREDGEEAEFLIAGVDHDGNEVYLHPGSEIDNEPYIYTDYGDVEAALEDYFEAVAEGEIEDEDQPTGEAPNPDRIFQQSGPPGRGSGPRQGGSRQRLLGRAVRLVAKNPRIILMILVVALVIWRHRSPGNNPLDNVLGRLRGGLGGANVEI